MFISSLKNWFMVVAISISVLLGHGKSQLVSQTNYEVPTPTPAVSEKISLTPTPRVKQSLVKITLTPTPTNLSNSNGSSGGSSSNNSNNSTTNSQNSPTNTPVPTATNQPSLTPNPTEVPSSPTIKLKPTTVPTIVPTATPTIKQTETQSASVSFSPDGSATPNAHGNANFNVLKNSNGYWDFQLISAVFSNLQPNRNYQLWICGINCSSQGNSAKFTTDANGNGGLSNLTINHAQGNDPVNKVSVWENPPGGEIPNDPKACFMVSLNSPACLKGNIGF